MQTQTSSMNQIETTSPTFQLGTCDVPASFAEQMQAAEVLAKAGVMVPKELRNQTGAVFAMMTYAKALNLPIGVALQHLYVFEDKDGNTHLEMSARLMGALVRRAGHRIVPVEENPQRVVLKLERCDDDTQTYYAEWRRAEAEQAGLLSRFGYTKYPKDMLFARCLSRLVRRWCPEVTMGAYLIGEVSEGGPDGDESYVIAAGEVYAQATRATTADEVKAIGARARFEGLLPVYLDGDTLERRLWQLLRDLGAEGTKVVDAEPDVVDSPVADAAPVEPEPNAACGCSIAVAAAHGPGPCPFRFADVEEIEL